MITDITISYNNSYSLMHTLRVLGDTDESRI